MFEEYRPPRAPTAGGRARRILFRMSGVYREGASPLGAIESVHQTGSGKVGCIVLLALVVLVFGIVESSFTGNLVYGVAYTLIAVGGGWFLIRRVRREPPEYIELHEEGLVQRLRGKETVVRFEEVQAVRRIPWRTSRGMLHERYSVTTGDGREIKFTDHSGGASVLLEGIQARVLPRIETDALRAFDAGRLVAFGPLALSEQGLHLPAGRGTDPWDDEPRPARVVPWAELQRVEVGKERVRFLDVHGNVKGTATVASIPNLLVFLRMMQLAIEQERQAPKSEAPSSP